MKGTLWTIKTYKYLVIYKHNIKQLVTIGNVYPGLVIFIDSCQQFCRLPDLERGIVQDNDRRGESLVIIISHNASYNIWWVAELMKLAAVN